MKKNILFLGLCLVFGSCLVAGGLAFFVNAPLAQDPAQQPQQSTPGTLTAETVVPGYQPSAAARVKVLVEQKMLGRTFKEGHTKLQQNGISCQLCHSAEVPTTSPDERNCIRCHGSMEDMAKITAENKYNPHASVHYGSDISCISCHKEHKPSVLLCADCHILSYKKFK